MKRSLCTCAQGNESVGIDDVCVVWDGIIGCKGNLKSIMSKYITYSRYKFLIVGTARDVLMIAKVLELCTKPM